MKTHLVELLQRIIPAIEKVKSINKSAALHDALFWFGFLKVFIFNYKLIIYDIFIED